jgi:glycosyltransferase involved in cell wall biosynthesis
MDAMEEIISKKRNVRFTPSTLSRSMSTIISIVSYPFLPAKTGGQKGIALFYKYFSRHCQLICITTKKNNPAEANYEVINTISNSPLRYINVFLFSPLYKQIKKQQATHLLLEHPYFGWLGILLKKVTGVKLIAHSHNIEFQRWKTLRKWWWPVLASYEKRLHRNADYNFFKTEEDKATAINLFGLKESKCAVITYGIEWNTVPSKNERQTCRMKLLQKHAIPENNTIFLFNGSLNYYPNLQAVKTIVEKINPLLLNTESNYKIIICGKGLPAMMNELKDYAGKNIIYTGFVDDISIYFKGSDVFINPVTEGGGIQTKLVEALGYNLNVVSARKGTIGIPPETTGYKMQVVEDNDWPSFALAMNKAKNIADTPELFFIHFYWQNIAAKANDFIN